MHNPALHIFVLDDEPILARTLASILCLHGFQAQPFTEPSEALAAARLQRPDVLVADVLTPTLTGIEVATAMRQLHPSCTIILFTGLSPTAEFWDTVSLFDKGIPVIEKPLHPEALISLIRRHVNGDPELNTLESSSQKGGLRPLNT